MGRRPGIKLLPVIVRLPAEVITEIDAIAGANARAKFIRHAIADALGRVKPVVEEGAE
jgi:hypothetical protein